MSDENSIATLANKPSTVTVPLSRGLFVVIETSDFPLVSCYQWHAVPDNNTFYAVGSATDAKTRRRVRMHRLILGVSDPAIQVDHRDRNGLNNARTNLRIATHRTNAHNRKHRTDGKSRFKGVHFRNRNRPSKWEAEICVDGRKVFLGCFVTEEQAAMAYDAAARLHFGEFALTNFPEKHLILAGN